MRPARFAPKTRPITLQIFRRNICASALPPKPFFEPTAVTQLGSQARSHFNALMAAPETATPQFLTKVSEAVEIAVVLPGDLLERPQYGSLYRTLAEKRPKILLGLMALFFEANPIHETTYGKANEFTKDLLRLGAIVEWVGDSARQQQLLARLGITNSEDAVLAMASHVKNLNLHLRENLGEAKDAKWFFEKRHEKSAPDGQRPVAPKDEEFPFSSVFQNMGGLHHLFERKSTARFMWKGGALCSAALAIPTLGFAFYLPAFAFLPGVFWLMTLIGTGISLFGDQSPASNINTLIRQHDFHQALAKIPLKKFGALRHNVASFASLQRMISEMSDWKARLENVFTCRDTNSICVTLKAPSGVFIHYNDTRFFLTHANFKSLCKQLNDLIQSGKPELKKGAEVLAPIFADRSDFDGHTLCADLEAAVPTDLSTKIRDLSPRNPENFESDQFSLLLHRHATGFQTDGGDCGFAGHYPTGYLSNRARSRQLVEFILTRSRLLDSYKLMQQEFATYKEAFGNFTKAGAEGFAQSIAVLHQKLVNLQGEVPMSLWWQNLIENNPNTWADQKAHADLQAAMEKLSQEIEPIKAVLAQRNQLAPWRPFNTPPSAEHIAAAVARFT